MNWYYGSKIVQIYRQQLENVYVFSVENHPDFTPAHFQFFSSSLTKSFPGFSSKKFVLHFLIFLKLGIFWGQAGIGDGFCQKLIEVILDWSSF